MAKTRNARAQHLLPPPFKPGCTSKPFEASSSAITSAQSAYIPLKPYCSFSDCLFDAAPSQGLSSSARIFSSTPSPRPSPISPLLPPSTPSSLAPTRLHTGSTGSSLARRSPRSCSSERIRRSSREKGTTRKGWVWLYSLILGFLADSLGPFPDLGQDEIPQHAVHPHPHRFVASRLLSVLFLHLLLIITRWSLLRSLLPPQHGCSGSHLHPRPLDRQLRSLEPHPARRVASALRSRSLPHFFSPTFSAFCTIYDSCVTHPLSSQNTSPSPDNASENAASSDPRCPASRVGLSSSTITTAAITLLARPLLYPSLSWHP